VSRTVRIILACVFGWLFLAGCVDQDANERAEEQIKECIANGGIPSFSRDGYAEETRYYGCTVVEP